MTRDEFLDKLHLAVKSNTIYIKGCFGAPLNEKNKKRYTNNLQYNKNRSDLINACDVNVFGFDCVNLIKGILWGWSANKNKTYGGANYKSNGVPDTNADGIMAYCDYVSDDFTKIEEGNIVWIEGHVGVYVGYGRVIESTPKWNNCVQYTYLGNITNRDDNDHVRTWKKHGKLKFVEYPSNIIKHDELWHTATKGDSLYKIGKAYGVSWKDIAAINGIKAPYIIRIGQRIRIK